MKAADFLARIQQQLATAEAPTPHPGLYTAPVRTLSEDLLGEFTARLTAVGGHAYCAEDPLQARLQCRDIIETLLARGFSLERAALSGHTLLQDLELDGLLRRMGLSVGFFTGSQLLDPVPNTDSAFELETADIGVTGVEYALASSGTLVVAASSYHPRAVSLLPPVHLAIVQRAQLLKDLAALARRIAQDAPTLLPSGLALITGPSRTADIEQTLSIGVHGPAEVHVVFV